MANSIGVQMVPPPTPIWDSVMKAVHEEAAKLPPDVDMALIGVATKNGGGNLAVVGRTPHGFEVSAWIGKRWDTTGLDWGAQVVKTFKWS
jgi:hypothetical protein